MKLKIIIISFLIVLPSLCSASISMSPSRFDFPDVVWKAGERYEIQPPITIANTDQETRNFRVSIGCIQDKKCPPGEWFNFTPSEFSLDFSQSQKIKIEMEIPRDTSPREYGDYEFFIQVEGLQRVNNLTGTSTSGLGMVNVAIGSRVNLKLAGKIPPHKVLWYWLQGNIFNRTTASINQATDKLGVPKEALLGILGAAFFGFLALSFATKMKNKRRMARCPSFQEFRQWEEDRQFAFLKQSGPDVDFIIKEFLAEINSITSGKPLTDNQIVSLPGKVRKEYLKRGLA